MKCPHCAVEIHAEFAQVALWNGALGKENGRPTSWRADVMKCPACAAAIIFIVKMFSVQGVVNSVHLLAYPKDANVRSAPLEVPADLAGDFNEACVVLADSPKASAALSRRCLQHLLRFQGFAQHDLAKAIDAVLLAKVLPTSLARNLDAVRNIGNFAAHPLKDTNSGAIVDVEPEEAEWNLDVLSGLFDFYYVLPAQDQKRIDALNAKLQAAGKPPMKA